jgi:hypothetical protein
MSWANGLVTATYPDHLCSDGDCVEISGAFPVGYNGKYVVNVLDDDTLTYSLETNPGVWSFGGVLRNYIEAPFKMSSYSKSPSFDLVQDSTTGIIYSVSTNVFQDNSAPIRFSARTSNIDGGNNHLKFYSRLELIGDKTDATAYIKYSDDDYQTWNKYRPINLSKKRSQLYRLGSSRRRAFELINYDNQPIRLSAIELSVDKGYT